jgi:DNA-directed RNA polymerase subunit RPC12/RpoP
MDIFDAQILCKHCKQEMQKRTVERDGFELRAVQCPACGQQILHPADMNGLEHFKNLQHKTFSVKLRMVGK